MQANPKRKQVRDEVANRCKGALSPTLPTLKVFTQQRVTVPEGTDHFINVFFAKGDVSRASESERDDNGALVIKLHTNSQFDVDDTLDDLMQHVEQVINTDPTLSGLIDDIEHTEWHYGIDEQTAFNWLAYVYSVSYETDI